jgi:pyrimidine operon attenuation protein/uracil phosphoribosyltransferase
MLPDFDSAFAELTRNARAELERRGILQPRMVGVLSGGAWVAERLRQALGIEAELGLLDISFHRDDFGRIGLNPSVRPSRLPWEVDGAHLVLVDDVLYTGRTVRAALNEIFDWGRPASVVLAALIARDGRELPIEAAAVGARVELGPGQQLKLRGPEPLRLELLQATV